MTNTFKGPTFRYGPNGEAEIFHDSRHVPEGWLDNPSKHNSPAETPVAADVLTHSTQEADDNAAAEAALANEQVATLGADGVTQEVVAASPTRGQIISELKVRGIAFRVTAKTEVLYALLMSYVERETEDET